MFVGFLLVFWIVALWFRLECVIALFVDWSWNVCFLFWVLLLIWVWGSGYLCVNWFADIF